MGRGYTLPISHPHNIGVSAPAAPAAPLQSRLNSQPAQPSAGDEYGKLKLRRVQLLKTLHLTATDTCHLPWDHRVLPASRRM